MRYVVAALAFLLTVSASAYDFSGNQIFVPIVSRVPGANGTQWRTDLTITNRSETFPTEVSMFFFPAGGGTPIQHKFDLDPLQTITKKDIVFGTFGILQRAGTIWMGAANDSVTLAAHARIYNTGNAAGEFGQVVHGMPPDKLPRVVWLSGLTGIDGNRTNVGIGNPNNTPAFFSITWYDKDGEVRGSVQLAVGPWDVMLINDIFSYLGLPHDEGLTLRIRSSTHLIYAYASVVRNDTGDAYTITGSGSE
ncbi:MAG TPA: hypothetical protein VFO89_04510 [Thermoanaerobaculia bacterium]|nr:hypothetical protein [Thermoanaerobaculia bacterium]